MLKFVVESNAVLSRTVQGYSHDKYYGMYSPENTMRYVNVLKNDLQISDAAAIAKAESEFVQAVKPDLERIVTKHGGMLLCGVPRSKREDSYPALKQGLKRALRTIAAQVPELEDGLDCIVRHTDTRTTHLIRSSRAAFGGRGEMPRRGITRDTCTLSPMIAGRDILLVDDIYTKNCDIDEDAIQALFDAGAKSVIFYSVGYTVSPSGYRVCA